MNIIHVMNSTALLPRALEAPLRRALRSFPVVVVTEARQTGKSTLVERLVAGEERSYLTLDDLDVLERSRTEPDALLRGRAAVTLDEVQRSPDLTGAETAWVADGVLATPWWRVL
jgi:predicted AAA+ superfamily ATPase